MIQRGCIQAGWERTGWERTGWDKTGTLRPGWRAGRIGTCMLDHRAPFRTDQTIRPVMNEYSYKSDFLQTMSQRGLLHQSSAERRRGKECVRTRRYRWSRSPYNKQNIIVSNTCT